MSGMRMKGGFCRMRKILCLMMILTLLISSCPLPGEAEEYAGPDPLCFEGEPDWSYEDGGLYIHIKKYAEKRFMNKENRNLVYYVADIQVKDFHCLKTAWAHDKAFNSTREEVVSKMAQRKGAVLAVNCDYAGNYEGGVIIRNGELLKTKTMKKRQLMIIDENGDFDAVTTPIETKAQATEIAETLSGKGAWQTLTFGPLLVKDGEYAGKFGSPFAVVLESSTDYEPRTGIGQISPLHYIIIVVDGRKESHSFGLNLEDFAQLFVDHGARFAFNLDGGGSTTLYFMGEVINRPSGGRERDVSDMLYIAPLSPDENTQE